MGFVWDYETKKKLFKIVEEKLLNIDEQNLPSARHTHSNVHEKYYKKAARYLDNLGCIRIVKVKISGWELEDSKEAENPKLPWKSINDKRYVHIENPLYFLKNKGNMKYLIRIPKDIAEKFLILGMP